MSLTDRRPVLFATSVGNTPAEADRVVRWQAAYPTGFVHAAESHTGQAANSPTWFDESRLSAIHAWRSAALRSGVELSVLVGWRPDVLAPPSKRVADWVYDLKLVLRSPVAWAKAFEPWAAAGWVLVVGALDADWWRALPEDAAIYCLFDATQKVATVTGVCIDMSTPVLAADAMRAVYAYDAQGLKLPIKPWERQGQPLAQPNGPVVPNVVGLLQPPAQTAGEWQMRLSTVLMRVGKLTTVLTETRPYPPGAETYLGNATASQSVLAEVDLRLASEAV